MEIYYIGGSPCAGKSTIAEGLAKEYGLFYFRADDGLEKYIRLGAQRGLPICRKQAQMSPEQIWMRDPRLQYEEELLFYEEIFPFILEDLRQLHTGQDIITEGACYLPALVQGIGVPADRYLSLTPKREFQFFHYRQRAFVPIILEGCSDTEQAFLNWMERDVLFAGEARRQCEEFGYRSLVNDGAAPIGEMAEAIAVHFGLKAR